ncbi:EAL domain-containing protein [Persephonella sp.]
MNETPPEFNELKRLFKNPLFESGRVVLFYLDEDLNVKAITPNVKTILGYTPEEFLTKKVDFRQITHEKDLPKIDQVIEESRKGKKVSYLSNIRLISKEGRTVWISCRKVFVKTDLKGYFIGYIFNKTKEIEERLLFETISKVAPVGIFLHQRGKLKFVNNKIEEITEYSDKELTKLSDLLYIIHEDDKGKVKDIISLRNRGIQKFANYRIKIITKSGKVKWIHINSETVFYKGEPSGIGTVVDVTKEVHLEKAKEMLFKINRLLMKTGEIKELLKNVVEIFSSNKDFSDVFISEVGDDGKIRPKFFIKRSNITDLFYRGFSIPEYEVLTKADYLYIRDIEEIEDFKLWKSILKKENVGSILLIPMYIQDSIKYIISIYAKEKDFFFDEEIAIYREISDDVSFAVRYLQQQEDLFKKEFFDTLTGLGNRKLLLSELHEMVKKEEEFYLVFIDIYNFRFINEIYGERIGDILLKEISNSLQEFLTEYKIFRSGSDTFALIVRDEDIMHVLEKVRLAFTIPFSIEDHIIQLDYNVSVVKYPEDASSETDIYIKGERTLELSKNKGKNAVLFYNERDYLKVKTIKEFEEKIESALIENRFFFKLQPVVDFKTDNVVAAEALIRWKTEDGHYIPPSEFIPIAEKTGQIKDIDNLMLIKVNDLINKWKKEGFNPVKISVNVTPQNIEDIIYKIKSTNKMVFFKVPEGELLLNSKYIIMEITERDLLDLYRQKKDIENLRKMGFEISIDDFGTGFSTLKYLANLNVDSIKIDMSFIKDMLSDENVYKLVQSIINIAKIFNIKTIAEGVETKEQYEELKRLGCDRYQGFYFSPPLEPEDFVRFLR